MPIAPGIEKESVMAREFELKKREKTVIHYSSYYIIYFQTAITSCKKGTHFNGVYQILQTEGLSSLNIASVVLD